MDLKFIFEKIGDPKTSSDETLKNLIKKKMVGL